MKAEILSLLLVGCAAARVEEYDGGNMTVSNYRMVNYYLPHCSACQSFKSNYEKLASYLPIDVFSVNCNDHREQCQEQSIENYPTVRIYKPDELLGRQVNVNHIHPYEIMSKLEFPEEQVDSDENYYDHVDQDPEFLKELEEVYNYKKEMLYNDMAMVIEQFMRNYPFYSARMTNQTEISKDAANSLQDWLLLLHKTTSMKPMQRNYAAFVKELHSSFQYIKKSEETLVDVLEGFHPEDWSEECQITFDGGNSYFCGLWKLLLKLAHDVEVYNEIAIYEEDKISELEVVKIVQNVEKQVGLGCDEDEFCKGILQTTYREGESLVLFFGKLRNNFQRYSLERQSGMLKVAFKPENALWPDPDRCPLCWTESADEEERTWNTEFVRAYVELEFGPQATWKELLPIYDHVFPEELDEYDEEEDFEEEEEDEGSHDEL